MRKRKKNRERWRIEGIGKIKRGNVLFKPVTVLIGKPSTNKSYLMKLKFLVEEVRYLLSPERFTYVALLMEKGKEISFLSGYTLKGFKELFESNFAVESRSFIAEKILPELKKRKGQLDSMSELEKVGYLLRNLFRGIFKSPTEIGTKFEIKASNYQMLFDGDFKFSFDPGYFFVKNGNNIFVETPLILELERYLPDYIGDFPYHIATLLHWLKRKEDFSFIPKEDEQFIKEFSNEVEKVIMGKIVKGQGGLVYQEKGKNFSIINTSSGTKSIGLLQYLVEERGITADTTLFWEEPEVHLHPEWQIKMARLLLFLASKGVTVVISTHSPLIAEGIKLMAPELGLKEKLAFNLLVDKGEKGVEPTVIEPYSDEWDLVQDGLLGPQEDLAWKYL